MIFFNFPFILHVLIIVNFSSSWISDSFPVGLRLTPGSLWTVGWLNRDWLVMIFLNYLHSFWITWHVMAHGLVMIFSGPSEAFFAWNHPSPTDSLDILDPLRIASWQAMAASVQTVNAKHLQALEDCMNVLLSHPIFDAVQSMPPQAIDGAAEQNEAGSQAGLACDLSCLSSLILSYCVWSFMITHQIRDMLGSCADRARIVHGSCADRARIVRVQGCWELGFVRAQKWTRSKLWGNVQRLR